MSQDFLLMTPEEAKLIQTHLETENAETDLLSKSINRAIAKTDAYISNPIEIPGHGEGGGYEHNRHKQNYINMNSAGNLWLITRDKKYLTFITDMLMGYAKVYPELEQNVSKDTNPPGRIFHQTLNENMWLMYASMAYACIKSELTSEQRDYIETRLFREMVTLFTETYGHDFDIIHNHGVWAVAGVGVCGLAIDDIEIANKAIYGLKGDGKTGGFLAQLRELFSPDGYYMEGPYYHRFAIRPILILAEAINRKLPELDIFNFEGGVIQRTAEALMKTVFPDGTFPAINDSSKTIGIDDEGLIIAASLCFKHYGASDNLIAMAQIQNETWIGESSIALSKAASNRDSLPLNWGSMVITDGPDGDRGGVSILRHTDEQQDVHMALMWYGQHGSDSEFHSALDHGHFDGLHVSWFNRGQEVLKDYGYGRWVNVEPKFGGRYIPENKSYCKQTVAHNTVTVDGKTQNNADTKTAEKKWGELQAFDTDASFGQVMSASVKGYYDGVDMTRTVFMLNRKEGTPLLVDLFDLASEEAHQYDMPVHYDGQVVRTNFDYSAHAELKPMGDSAGYQHLWNLAESDDLAESSSLLFSWLMGNSYYTMVTAASEKAKVHFCRTGANDHDFNLRNEPALIVRDYGKNHLFATVYEQHGTFVESLEISENARGTVTEVRVVHNCENASIVKITDSANGDYLVACWKGSNKEETHQITVGEQQFSWTGPVNVTVSDK
ncbi:heparinase II/III domain-containing protein [Reinekea marinisedimentorum]|uniref:heparinase II/III domain-containing protein n=1 Tax=Reinekea marinisedimentorum TaxID=230495 RepID=UPI001A9F5ED6|nr:heparinase II/III family protein [Reinekea marinisedimentorum]